MAASSEAQRCVESSRHPSSWTALRRRVHRPLDTCILPAIRGARLGRSVAQQQPLNILSVVFQMFAACETFAVQSTCVSSRKMVSNARVSITSWSRPALYFDAAARECFDSVSRISGPSVDMMSASKQSAAVRDRSTRAFQTWSKGDAKAAWTATMQCSSPELVMPKVHLALS